MNSWLRRNDVSSDANENEVDYITTRDCLSDVNETAQRPSEKLDDDVSKKMKPVKLPEVKILIGMIRTSITKPKTKICRIRPKTK